MQAPLARADTPLTASRWRYAARGAAVVVESLRPACATCGEHLARQVRDRDTRAVTIEQSPCSLTPARPLPRRCSAALARRAAACGMCSRSNSPRARHRAGRALPTSSSRLQEDAPLGVPPAGWPRAHPLQEGRDGSRRADLDHQVDARRCRCRVPARRWPQYTAARRSSIAARPSGAAP